MTQKFKAVYFPSPSDGGAEGRSLTLAFGDSEGAIFRRLKSASSYELRNLLGFQSYEALVQAAEADGVAINTYCIRILRNRLTQSEVTPVYQYSLPGMEPMLSNAFDPLQATFKGGVAEPLHNWYPLLEGYSPRFVQTALTRFAPQAKTLLDPFCGSGTTAITGMRDGLKAYYCEVNPVLQFMIRQKVAAYQFPLDQKQKLAERMRGLAKSWPDRVYTSRPDDELRRTYGAAFGSSTFFDSDTFETVLQARTAVDQLDIIDQPLASMVTVSVLASLLSSSLLVRAGDIRYRNDRERERMTDFLGEVARRLLFMADDLDRLEPPNNGEPTFLCENAKNLDRLPARQGFHAVITSPPYLNGTNYFRNTKLELWFLRCLQSQADLAAFRYKVVTSGINDVTVRKTDGVTHPAVVEIVAELNAKAYDMRIPRMVAGYFADMQQVFAGLRKHLAPNATIAVDIGDSIYAGVHVSTHQLLRDVLNSLGYVSEDEVVLRKRVSHDGTELSQVLLVFSYSACTVSVPAAEQTRRWEKSWTDVKHDLPFKQQPYAKRNWGHPLHSLCSYQGKMKPSLAYFLVRTFAPTNGKMLDPFAGVGTIPFEASLQGTKAFGFDISPAALSIARAKIEKVDPEICSRLILDLSNYLSANHVTDEELASAQAVSFNGSIPDFFHPLTLDQVLLARRYFQQHPPLEASSALVFASLLHILHGNRPYALSRRSHPLTPFKPTGEFERRELIPRLQEKVARALKTPKPEAFRPGFVFNQDATSWWPQDVIELDAIITSPPFFDSTRFHIGNWMRLWFCGWERPDFDERPRAFVDERQKKSFAIYEPIFRQARERLTPNGVFVIHLGESVKCDMAKELSRIAAPWFRVADLFTEDVTDCEQHGIRDKGTVTAHQFLVLI
jgi:tRNA G10  N-methylase Trm11